MMKYLDPQVSPVERAQDLLSRMDLEEKIRQLGCTMYIPLVPIETQDLVGGIGASTVMGADNLPERIRELQDYVMEHSPHRIPALIHGEALAGPVSIVGGNQYPISIGLGATFQPEIVREMCVATRKQLLANGIRHALSPVADLARDLRWGRCNETYGNDPTLCAAMTVAFVKGIQGEDLKEGVAATGKHFLGYSQTEGGLNMHKGMAEKWELREQFAKPFEAAIHMADIKSMMNAYNSVNGMPITASKEILSDLLRDELNFEGVVISDYGSAAQIIEPYRMAQTPVEAGIMCLKAGLDIEAPGRDVYGDEFMQAVREGKLDISYVDRAVLRILTLKFELGLFENPYGREDLLEEAMDNTVNNQRSYEAALKSMTLVKNNGILPITDQNKKIAVIGPSGNCVRMLFSHYTAIAMAEMIAGLATEGDTQQGFNITELLGEGLKANEEADTNSLENLSSVAAKASNSSLSDKADFDPMIKMLYPGCKTIFEALQEYFHSVRFAEGCNYKGNDSSGMDAAVELARDSDIVILCVGGKNGLGASSTTGEGVDSCSLDLPGLQEQLMRKIYEANPNMVVAHTDCRPLVSPWAYEHAPAILEGWLPNTFGGNAIADVLCGKYNPGGRTPVDIPRSVGHLPVYHYQLHGSSAVKNKGMIPSGYADGDSSVLAPFGYGLSYTKFRYYDAQIRDDHGMITISIRIENIGERTGDEVAQLYGEDLYASKSRPNQELIGFHRVTLKPGESKLINFRFCIDAMSFPNQEGQWFAEAGKFRFFVGGHSDDVQAEFYYELEADLPVDPNHRCFFAETAEKT